MQAKLTVDSQLKQILEDVKKLEAGLVSVQDSFGDAAKQAGKGIEDNSKKMQDSLEKTESMSRRVFNHLKEDLKTLMNVGQLAGGLKLSAQYGGALKEIESLNSAVHKYGNALGIATDRFAKFQSSIMKGFGQIGLSTDAAAAALEGLMGTGVKGEQAVTAAALNAGSIAQIANQRGQESNISKGMAEVIRSGGGNVNDPKQFEALGDQLNKAFQKTGISPTQMLSQMQSALDSMDETFKKKMDFSKLAQFAAVSQTGGPGATKFFEDFMSKSPIARKALEAQGFQGVVNGQGEIDFDKFGKGMQGVLSRVGGDRTLAAKTLGVDEETAKGMLRLFDNLNKASEAAKNMKNAQDKVTDSLKNSRGIVENFSAMINRGKGALGGVLAPAAEMLNKGLGKMAESDTGSIAGSIGGALLAGGMMRGGLKGIGGLLKGGAGTLAKGAAAEAVTGQKTVPVYVVNAGEIGSGVGMGGVGGGMMGKVGKAAGKVAMVGAALEGGVMIGDALNEMGAQKGINKVLEMTGLEDKITQGFIKALELTGNMSRSNVTGPLKIQVYSNDDKFNAKADQPRGPAQ